jgi:hypothetical protein
VPGRSNATSHRAGISTVGVSANPLVSRGTNLAQWGPPLPPDFIGGTPGPALVGRVVGTLAGSDETTLGKLIATVRALTR